uniref:Eukaryotic translation initiation factor 4E binding protein 1 n=1 Tax=Anser cygnoides TaxID=8845 RepID=A0A8B9DGG0_ANSCY
AAGGLSAAPVPSAVPFVLGLAPCLCRGHVHAVRLPPGPRAGALVSPGTRIIYDRKFLMECRNSPVAKTPPSDLPDIPGVTSPSVEEVKVENNHVQNYDEKPSVGERTGPEPGPLLVPTNTAALAERSREVPAGCGEHCCSRGAVGPARWVLMAASFCCGPR